MLFRSAHETLDGLERDNGDSLGHGEFYSPAAKKEIKEELSQMPKSEAMRIIDSVEEEMVRASSDMDFERAAEMRDRLVELKAIVEGESEDEVITRLKQGARRGSKYATRRKYHGKK